MYRQIDVCISALGGVSRVFVEQGDVEKTRLLITKQWITRFILIHVDRIIE